MGQPNTALMLIEQFDLITLTYHPFDKDRSVDSSQTTVTPSHFLQDLWVHLGGIRVKSDHLAPGVPLDDRDLHSRSDPKSPADKIVLPEALSGLKVHIDICPKPPRIDRLVDLVAKLTNGLN